jgi:hypothetical protein
MAPRQTGLGAPTIMDRGLADQHGTAYVHLAVFAIDVDRVRAHCAGTDDGGLPFAWEVFLTEYYLLQRFDPRDLEQISLLEDACLSVLDEAPGQQRLGEQLPFAVYDAVTRGVLPDTLASVFHHWRSKPKTLVKDLAGLWADADVQARKLAQLCLQTPLEPPAAPPTVTTWRQIAGESG